MKKLVFTIVIGLSCLLVASQAQAQVSGHRGGIFVIKTDLMSPLLDWGAHAGLEIVAFRKISFVVDYNLQREFLYGNFLKRNREFDYDMRYGEDALMRAHTISVGLRMYSNKALPAPQGSYWEFKLGIARYQISGVLTPDRSSAQYTFTYGPLAAGRLSTTYGHQWILFSRMSLDLGFSVNFNMFSYSNQYLNVNETYPGINEEIEVSEFTDLYGGNIWNFGSSLGVGFGLHLAVGIVVP